MRTKSKYCVISLVAITIFTLILFIITKNTNTTSSSTKPTSTPKETSTEDSSNIIADKNENEDSFGSEEIGFLSLGKDYKTNDLSDLSESGQYYVGMNDRLCVGIVLQNVSFEEAVSLSSNLEDYELKEEVEIGNDESYIIKQLCLASSDNQMHCITTIINDIKTKKVIAIAISSTTPITSDDFLNESKNVLSTYRFNNEQILVDKE